jgi:hypothetical protein
MISLADFSGHARFRIVVDLSRQPRSYAQSDDQRLLTSGWRPSLHRVPMAAVSRQPRRLQLCRAGRFSRSGCLLLQCRSLSDNLESVCTIIEGLSKCCTELLTYV